MNFGELDKKVVIEKIISSSDFLFIQDIDGVCVPLVKNPLERKINMRYVIDVSKIQNNFFVLTCGEHEGYRGVNRLIEKSLNSKSAPKKEGLYLPGLAACGAEYQNQFGVIDFPGVSDKEIKFLKSIPKLISPKLKIMIKKLFPNLSEAEIKEQINSSIFDTRFSPTLNLNKLLDIGSSNHIRIEIQKEAHKLMQEILLKSKEYNLDDSFFLHISPNLGLDKEQEIIKLASEKDLGTTDIQFLLKGAYKDSGLLVLLNKFIYNKYGQSPFGENFNFRNSPKTLKEKIELCKKNISPKHMPLIIGVGDTITSQENKTTHEWDRGGSDRSFLTLIQELGKAFQKENQIIYVDSSSGEVYRPSTRKDGLQGITDKADILKFNLVFRDGPKEYMEWFSQLCSYKKKT
tara:strand:- start:7271 stop:8479 length:1209 start_codon:yes stop_codon:yes gene_type:complete